MELELENKDYVQTAFGRKRRNLEKEEKRREEKRNNLVETDHLI